MTSRLHQFLLATCVALVAVGCYCGSPASTQDSGEPDQDSGTTDVDSGMNDMDAGTTDVDSGMNDIDAGMNDMDAGHIDAGLDGGGNRDAGASDGGCGVLGTLCIDGNEYCSAFCGSNGLCSQPCFCNAAGAACM